MDVLISNGTKTVSEQKLAVIGVYEALKLRTSIESCMIFLHSNLVVAVVMIRRSSPQITTWHHLRTLQLEPLTRQEFSSSLLYHMVSCKSEQIRT